MKEKGKTNREKSCPKAQSQGHSVQEAAAEWTTLAIQVEMQSNQGMLSVLVTLARLGCKVERIVQEDCHAELVILAPSRISHRVKPCLFDLIEVLSVDQVVSI